MEPVEAKTASGGIAIGPAFVYVSELPTLSEEPVADVEAEVARYDTAETAVDRRLADLEKGARETAGDEVAEIFGVHRMFLADPSVGGAIREKIRSGKLSAPVAVRDVTTALAEEFAAIGDDYFSQRAIDIQDIGRQLIRRLLGLVEGGLSGVGIPSIIFAHDLTPSETMALPAGRALAFCTELGSATSHTAILAKSLGIPAVVGMPYVDVQTGDLVGVDGDTGEVFIGVDDETRVRLEAKKAEQEAEREHAKSLALQPAVTTDGRQIEIAANIGDLAGALQAVRAGAEGVGLLRTEFLFLDRGSLPDEEEQYEAYKDIFEVFGDRPIVVRTLDVGGDKEVPGIDMGDELNPFLGKRGIRLTLAEPALFQPQLRALLRAGVGHDLRIMFPMIATIVDLRAARAALDAAAAALDADGIERTEEYQVGIMIEVPSAALIADQLAPLVDFFSVGTNDLTQYTLAIDRTNAEIAGSAEPYHPAVLRLIDAVVDAAHSNGKWVGVCGEFAGDPLAVGALLGLGIDELSMSAPMIPLVKEKIRSWSISDAEELLDRLLFAPSIARVKEILKEAESAVGKS